MKNKCPCIILEKAVLLRNNYTTKESVQGVDKKKDCNKVSKLSHFLY